MNLDLLGQRMQEKRAQKDFDSYAVAVRVGNEVCTLFSENVNAETYFDIASCGKILVTTPLVLQTIGKGLLSLENTLGQFFANVPAEKQNITIGHLLTHTSGIVRINLSEEIAQNGYDAVAEQILAAPLAFAPGSDYVYSCNGMILLGFILEKIYGKPLETLFEEFLKKPLGYTRSVFNLDLAEKNAAICYRSENVDGLEHPWDDENIRVLKTSAGSGGQFFALTDLIKFADAVLRKDERLYPKEFFAMAEQERSPACAKESYGLGWLYVDEKYPQTGKLFPTGSFGHCGHCGQSIFFNREKEMYVILLTNATRFAAMRSGFRGYDYGKIMKMREELHNVIWEDLHEQGIL